MKAGCAAQKLQFEAHGKRDVVADFDGGRMTSDGGGLLLREANCCLGDLMARLGQCVSDFRQQGSVEHTATDLIAQRVCALALGYEDLNDHGTLRRDRRPDARPAGRPFLSWLLPGALLSAAVHFLRAPRAVCAAADGGPGRLRRQRGGAGAHRGTDPGALAGDPDPHPRGRGVLPRRDPELVRSQCGGLRARQGRAPAAGRQSVLRGDQPGTLRNPVAAAAVRAGLLRPRRDGEPHQGAAAVSVRRPHQQRDDAR